MFESPLICWVNTSNQSLYHQPPSTVNGQIVESYNKQKSISTKNSLFLIFLFSFSAILLFCLN